MGTDRDEETDLPKPRRSERRRIRREEEIDLQDARSVERRVDRAYRQGPSSEQLGLKKPYEK